MEEVVVEVGVVEERVDSIVHYKKEHKMTDILADRDWGFFCSAVVVRVKSPRRVKRCRERNPTPVECVNPSIKQ